MKENFYLFDKDAPLILLKERVGKGSVRRRRKRTTFKNVISKKCSYAQKMLQLDTSKVHSK